MLGDIVRISENLILIEGKVPRSILREPDIANAVLYKKANRVFLIDAGATLEMRKALLRAIESFKPFDSFVLLNSHGHPDHTGNNGIIGEVAAGEKRHFISRPGLAMMDFSEYFLGKYGEVSRYCHYLDGPRFPFSLLTRPMKLLRLFGRKREYFMVKKSLSKFKPFDTSVETAECFEDAPSRELNGPLNGPLAGWKGWQLFDSLYALESRGHSPDSISFYLADEKTLILADETFLFFNCWPDSSRERIERTLELSLQMARKGHVETLITGHEHEVFTGAKIESHLTTLLSDYRTFRQIVLDIVRDHSTGVTVNRIYALLRKRKDEPVLKKYFAMEFPRMPPMLRIVITSLLLSEGCPYQGPRGRVRFSIPTE